MREHPLEVPVSPAVSRGVLMVLGVLVAPMLTGCPAKDAPAPTPSPVASGPAKDAAASAKRPETTQLLLWHSYRGAEREAIDAVVTEYNKAGKGSSVKALAIPFDALNDKITAAVPRGHGPDLFIFAHNMVGPWADQGVVEPIGAWATDATLGRFLDRTVKALVYKADLYGLPLAFKTLALYRNTALAPEAPATLDALVAASRKARDEKAGIYGLVFDATKLYFNAPWLHAFGATVIGDDGLPGFANEQGAAAVAWSRDLMKVHKVVPEETSTHLVTTLFNEGKAAFMLSGPWYRAEAKAGLTYAVSPLPKRGDSPARPLLGAEAVMISAKSKHKELAYSVADYLTSDASAAMRWKTARQTVANKATYELSEVKADAFTAAFRAQLDDAVTMSASPRMQAVWSAADRALHRAIKGGVDPLKALQEADLDIKRDIERAGK